MQPTYRSVNIAYQLHYYLAFRTYNRRPYFMDSTNSSRITEILSQVCIFNDYHLLKSKCYPDHIRMLVSLKPEHDISTVLKRIKVNTSREYRSQLSGKIPPPPFWGRGSLAQSVGKMSIEMVKQYIANQSEHHGYANRNCPPVFRYKTLQPRELKSAHIDFDLNYHIVLSTRFRASVFDSILGQELTDYWLKVAGKSNFIIDRITVLPDHVHLIVKTVPTLSIEDCLLKLMNNSDYYFKMNFPATFLDPKIDQLWQPSAYVGTCGKASTALVKAWLSSE